MLDILSNSMNETVTENGGKAYISSKNYCMDLFFMAGASRCKSEEDISKAVTKAFCEDPDITMKIIFFARDVRGGLGERRFFRTAVSTLVDIAPESVRKNIEYFAEYGRYDDLLTLLHTKVEDTVIELIGSRLKKDIESMKNGKKVSLLAKWLPSVNASSVATKEQARYIAHALHFDLKTYRQTLSALRKYLDIIENRLRESDYTFDYEFVPSCAMFKYRKAFIRNDYERYDEYIDNVNSGDKKMNMSVLYPYQIVRRCIDGCISSDEISSLDTMWKNLNDYGNGEENQNAIAVVDGSGSMYGNGELAPICCAISLGLYFAEHNKGVFANHFITFSENPKLVEVKGKNIFEKVRYCQDFNEVANTNLEKVFAVILAAAVNNKVPPEEMPSRLYIISDMEFDHCVIGGNKKPLFNAMKTLYEDNGYKLPEVIFWNAAARHSHIPVTVSDTGCGLVSGSSPAIFNMIRSGDISPMKIMLDIIGSERYSKISA